MTKPRIPKTDSIKKLAAFWDSHELTDFEGELEVETEPVFVRKQTLQVPLDAREAEAVEELAQAKGVSREELVRTWVREKVVRWRQSPSTKPRG